MGVESKGVDQIRIQFVGGNEAAQYYAADELREEPGARYRLRAKRLNHERWGEVRFQEQWSREPF